MDEAQRFVNVRELHLANCGPVSVANRVNVVQGLRTSAAFFTFLRANLVLSPSSPISSNFNTPQLEPWSSEAPAPSSSSIPCASGPSSPSPLGATPPLVPLDDIPPLSLEPLQTYDDKVAGLNLVADSVAQMQQRAASALVFHPSCLGALAVACVAAHRCSRRLATTHEPGLALLLLLICGVAMTYLAAVRYFASGYVDLAEQMRWSWLKAPGGVEEDLILAARYGDAIIGVLVLRLEPRFFPTSASGGKRRSRSLSLRGGKGVIRAWTTRLRYRGKGIGKDLLLAAVKIVKERCGRDAEVGFAQEHANSVMLLPGVFNGPFRRDEMRAAKALEAALEEWESSKKRKR